MKQLIRNLEAHVNEGICIAFSGGVDSTLLLYAACQAVSKINPDKTVLAVTFETRLHPHGDTEEAKELALSLGARHKVIVIDEFSDERITNNPTDRCYLCKSLLFRTLLQTAEAEGYHFICEGSNMDDTRAYRPGLKAIREAGVHSPLIDCHLYKKQIRAISKQAGLSTASKPSTPCMATRLPYNTKLDYELLDRLNRGETFLRELGFYNVRLRYHDPILRIEIDPSAFPRLMEQSKAIVFALKKLDFPYITLDLEGFRSGSMDL